MLKLNYIINYYNLWNFWLCLWLPVNFAQVCVCLLFPDIADFPPWLTVWPRGSLFCVPTRDEYTFRCAVRRPLDGKPARPLCRASMYAKSKLISAKFELISVPFPFSWTTGQRARRPSPFSPTTGWRAARSRLHQPFFFPFFPFFMLSRQELAKISNFWARKAKWRASRSYPDPPRSEREDSTPRLRTTSPPGHE